MTQPSATSSLNERLSETYNETPYRSHPFPQSTPEHLLAIATLFAIKATSLDKARVLELGCASGGNIIPFAVRYPNAQIVGIDLSTTHIAEGHATIERLGLKNIVLKHADIAHITPSFGQFDYIICHGVYSWVPPEVQAAILRISSENLSPKGLAYISYNTYPGWKYREVVRDAMMFRGANRDTPQERLSYARGMIDFLHEKSQPNSLTRKSIDEVLPILKSSQDYYLLHDFLELCNAPCYFNDFINKAKTHGITYLAESEPNSMFLSNYSREIIEPLIRECEGSQVLIEQHLDFLTGRAFRQTILLKSNRTSEISYQLDTTRLDRLHFAGIFTPLHHPSTSNESAKFQTISGVELSLIHPMAVQAAQILNEHYPATMQPQDIARELSLRQPRGEKKTANECLAIVFQFLENMIIKGMIRFRAQEIALATQVSKKPRRDPRACETELNSPLITNVWHDVIALNVVEKSLLPHLDGLHSHNDLLQVLLAEVGAGRLSFNKQGVLLTDAEAVEASAQEHVSTSLFSLQRKGLLVS